MKRLLTATLTVLGVLGLATAAQAVPIQSAIGLSIDGSGSISTSNFHLQRVAYASVLGDASILPADGSVVIYVNQFSEGVQTEAVARRISSEADRNALIADISTMTQLNSLTNIGGGILDAAHKLDAFLAGFAATEFATDFRALIDVSTDGQYNRGPDPELASLVAINGSGLNITFDQINCLGITSAADCGWIPAGSFSLTAATFDDFEGVLRTKIGRELGTGTVPEPASVGLLGLGLLAMGAMRRRRRG